MHWPRIHGLCSVSWCLAEGQWNGDQRRPMGRKAREGLYSLTTVSRYQNKSAFYWSKRQWVAVASAGPYADLHLIPDR